MPINIIKKAIKLATHSPSSCNRQPWKTYVVTRKSIIHNILSIQNGNKGFGKSADKLIVVTSDLNCYFGINERNQAFIDGGMYSMSLLYTLHSYGIAACSLNWAYSAKQDLGIRKIVPINKSEVINLIIAIGSYPKGEYRVARSRRTKTDRVFKVL